MIARRGLLGMLGLGAGALTAQRAQDAARHYSHRLPPIYRQHGLQAEVGSLVDDAKMLAVKKWQAERERKDKQTELRVASIGRYRSMSETAKEFYARRVLEERQDAMQKLAVLLGLEDWV